MLCLGVSALSFHHPTRAPRSALRPAIVSMALGESTFDVLLSQGKSAEAVELLRSPTTSSSVELSEERIAKLLDAACDASAGSSGGASDGAALLEQQANIMQAEMELQMKQQNDLLDCYTVLAEKGALRGFGSTSSVDALPAPNPRVLLPDDQRRLTGLPTSAFAPPRGNSNGSLLAGALSAAALFSLANFLQVDFRVLGAAFGSLLLADRVLLRGTFFEVAARTLRPKYRKTVIQHEAGHFLCAYLLGMPLQACLLDPWSALKDGRFSGAAGTVFFDPALGDGMAKGTLRRETLDRYSVVVLAGIAAEAMVNGQAEGGQADEQALINLLASLNGGKAWDLPRIQNQARWGASQALLLLREYKQPYEALCASLERGDSTGEAIVCLEASITGTFGRNGELPAETRARKAKQAQLTAQQQAATTATSVQAADDREALEAERKAVADKLKDVKRQLEAIGGSNGDAEM